MPRAAHVPSPSNLFSFSRQVAMTTTPAASAAGLIHLARCRRANTSDPICGQAYRPGSLRPCLVRSGFCQHRRSLLRLSHL